MFSGISRKMMRPTIQILFRDADIIALSKPQNVLSTPGREMRIKPVSRSEEWTAAINELYYSKQTDISTPEAYSNATEVLRKHSKIGFPRQKEKFIIMLGRLAKIKDEALKRKIWDDLVEIDTKMHSIDTSSLPNHLYSAADFARDVTGQTIHNVHRLDLDTSGVLLFARSTAAASDLARQFREREVEKIYIALLHGAVADDLPSLIDAPLIADESSRLKQKVDLKGGKPSQTIIEIIKPNDPTYIRRLSYFPPIPDITFSMVKLKPLTGRTHQLRVHTLHIGHPMIGDTLYSTELESDADKQVPRLCLHAESISFTHPITKEPMDLYDYTGGEHRIDGEQNEIV